MASLGFDEFEEENEESIEEISSLITPESDTDYGTNYIETYFTSGKFDARVDADEIKYCQEQQQAQLSFDSTFSETDTSVDTANENDIIVSSDISEKEKQEAVAFCDSIHKITIDTYEWIVGLENEATDLINKVCDQKTPRRTYTNETIYPKANFSKPRTEQSSSKTIKLLLLAGGVLGIFLGTQGNNYYEYSDGKITNNISCVLNSLIIEDLPMASSINTGVFITGLVMGFFIVAAIYGIILLETSQSKASRIGHEHGSAHLAKSSDYKTFKNKFMER